MFCFAIFFHLEYLPEIQIIMQFTINTIHLQLSYGNLRIYLFRLTSSLLSPRRVVPGSLSKARAAEAALPAARTNPGGRESATLWEGWARAFFLGTAGELSIVFF